LKLAQIIFWNVKRRNLTNFVCALTASTNADIVVLAENIVSSKETLLALQTNVSQDFYFPEVISKSDQRFHCFCRNPQLDLSETHKGGRTSVRKLQIGHNNTLLVLVHGIDIRNHDSEARQEFAHLLGNELRFLQKEKKTNKLILLGDFNMNPFERGMNMASGLNAMMTKASVEPGYRTHGGVNYDFYYNPMWSLFGDNTNGPAGTIYDTSDQGPYGWSMLDQVIIHHSIVGLFDSVKILTEAGTESLMSRRGYPDAHNASDHFPILVNFSEDNNE
jgi:endonuclease/exonuclease/phosphatase (EEP) superfamily protein YafD